MNANNASSSSVNSFRSFLTMSSSLPRFARCSNTALKIKQNSNEFFAENPFLPRVKKTINASKRHITAQNRILHSGALGPTALPLSLPCIICSSVSVNKLNLDCDATKAEGAPIFHARQFALNYLQRPVFMSMRNYRGT